jgi:hypothetical protein
MESLLDIVDQGERRYGDRLAFSMRGDDGSIESWTYRELARRSRTAASSPAIGCSSGPPRARPCRPCTTARCRPAW